MTLRSNPNVVRAHTPIEYTSEQINELKRCANDPVYFIRRYIKVQHPLLGNVSFDLYPYQEELINNFRNHRYNIILSARQTGKSTTSVAYILWYAMFNFDKTVLIVSNKNYNAMEMIAKIRYAYENLPDWLKPGVVDDGWNKHNISFDNHSRIVSQATTPQSGRTLAISLLFCDEFAFVNPGIQEKFWSSVSPTLATGGSCIIASTPNGDSDLFATLWNRAEVQAATKEGMVFKSRHVKWDEPPGRDEKFKMEQIAVIGEEKWRQEYECEFISSEALLIPSTILNAYNNHVSNPLPNERGFVYWEPLRKGRTYLIGIDPATGSGNDSSVIEVFEFPAMNQVAEFRSNTTNTQLVYLSLRWMLRQIEIAGAQAYFSVENNGVGESIVALYQNDEEQSISGELVSESGKNRLGMNTTGKSKLRACITLKQLVERGKIGIKSKVLLAELKRFIRKSGTFMAQQGSTDDCISAVLIIIRLLEEIATYEQSAFDALYTIDESEYFEDFDENDQGLPFLIDFTGPSISPTVKQGSGAFVNPNDPESFDPWFGRDL